MDMFWIYLGSPALTTTFLGTSLSLRLNLPDAPPEHIPPGTNPQPRDSRARESATTPWVLPTTVCFAAALVNGGSTPESCVNAWIRASTTSRIVQPSRRAQSRTEYPSRTDMTKTNRGSGDANLLTISKSESPSDSISTSHERPASPPSTNEWGRLRRIALMTKQRLLHDRSHPLKMQVALEASSTVATKQSSASA